jgi:hypothetical protein
MNGKLSNLYERMQIEKTDELTRVTFGYALGYDQEKRLDVALPLDLKDSALDHELRLLLKPTDRVRYVEVQPSIELPGLSLERGENERSSEMRIGLGLEYAAGDAGRIMCFVRLPTGEPGILAAGCGANKRNEGGGGPFHEGVALFGVFVEDHAALREPIAFVQEASAISGALEIICSRVRYGVPYAGNVMPVDDRDVVRGQGIGPAIDDLYSLVDQRARVYCLYGPDEVRSIGLESVTIDVDNVVVQFGHVSKTFNGLIEIEWDSDGPLARPGGPGLVVVGVDGRLFGLAIHFASGTLVRNGRRTRVSYCVPLADVLRRFAGVEWIQ